MFPAGGPLSARFFPNAPCLDAGSSNKPTYIPSDHARVLKGQRKVRLDPKQQEKLVQQAAVDPQVGAESPKTLNDENILVACEPQVGIEVQVLCSPKCTGACLLPEARARCGWTGEATPAGGSWSTDSQ